MINNPTNGLRVVHAFLIRARTQAYESGAKELATLLDDLEYLPSLMLAAEDETQVFREYVEMMATRHKCARAIEILDSD